MDKPSSSESVWEAVLLQNLAKTSDRAPDFAGTAQLGGNTYDAAAWLSQISRGANVGRPYLSVQLSYTGNTSTRKVNVSLWEKHDRASDTDAHFKTREILDGQMLQFAAWIQPTGPMHALRLRVEPSA